ncbi:prepilin-type N-terminal cleavage/methylation domain-containing protein [Acinetobacter nectaris]|uniref:prepilin-type N-terminal cleavage/methylation domain-containing protein n=1 Tax=Acinetobacter nectaris TaxID=1219382 RepID=UPI001F2313AA|nr:prepilin-type N-terminal cleavage/methylation domain-containing protein [Acinetobacter nectaris]MCF8999578.1 PilW family protein [Acinetobacter nectaris]MCF9027184.1 PilW family protein [Acinetobacter nectaris]
MYSSQKGFTLIELMVALTLGLIIIAAATMLLISAQRSLALQQSAAEIQNNANFAFDYIVKDLRSANYGNDGSAINLTAPQAGVVLSTANVIGGIDANAMSRNAAGPSNVNVQSDQLTIQYLPTPSQTFNCQGDQIKDFNTPIIERYFIRQDSSVFNGETKGNGLALVCEAGTATTIGTKAGQIIMPRADYMRVLLVVRQSNNNLQEIPVNTYTANSGDVVGVKVTVLARSTQRVSMTTALPTTFNIADQTVSLSSTAPQGFLRDVITQTVAFRNAMGVN